jgi:hypothetical protein
MQQMQKQKSKWPTRVRIIGFLIALLILITGATIWIWNSMNSVPALLTTIFGVLATIFTFLQLIPVIFPQKPPEPAFTPQPAPVAQTVHNYYFDSSAPAAPPPFAPPTISSTPFPITPSPNPLTLRALPLPTDPRSIQQREVIVKEIYTLLVEPNTAAVALIGVGGIGSQPWLHSSSTMPNKSDVRARDPFGAHLSCSGLMKILPSSSWPPTSLPQ